MSYIRCLSNPEALYIYGAPDGIVEVSYKKDELYAMPGKAFEGVMRKWYLANSGHKSFKINTSNYDYVKYKKAVLEETPDFKWKLSYPNWEVTLFYIAHNVMLQSRE